MPEQELYINDINLYKNDFIELSNLDVLIGTHKLIKNYKFIFRLSDKNMHSKFGNGTKIDILQIVDDIEELKEKTSEITGINTENVELLLKEYSYNPEDIIEYILDRSPEEIEEHLNELKVKYKDDVADNLRYIATFYGHFEFHLGLRDLLGKYDYWKNYKIYLEATEQNEYNYQFSLSIKLLINKSYLNNIYEIDNVKIPEIFRQLIEHKKLNLNQTNDIKIDIQKIMPNVSLNKNYKREPFMYQKNNIKNMINIENRTNLEFETYLATDDLVIQEIEGIEEKMIYNSSTRNLIKPESLEKYCYKPKGGVLCDNIGLGKTFSMIGLIAETLQENNNPTLVLSPTRLCKQWLQEIDDTYSMKTGIITSITQFKKIIKSNIDSYDIIILSYTFLTNEKYKEYILNENNPFILKEYNWKRIILDEGHEYLNRKFRNKKHNLEVFKKIVDLKSEFKWLCSGTPFIDLKSSWEVILFLCNFYKIDSENIKNEITRESGKKLMENLEDPIEYLEYLDAIKQISKGFYHEYKNLLSNIFIKNTKESVNHLINIPEPIINNTFLKQNEIEQAMYNGALGDKKKMIQMCSHILINDDNLSILGNEPLPLDEIHKKMTTYYGQKIIRIEKKINKIIEKENNLNIIVNDFEIERKKEFQTELNSCKAKFNIFSALEQKIKEDNCCPICLDELNTKIKAITPCGHVYCVQCLTKIMKGSHGDCPYCREKFIKEDIEIIKPNKDIIDHHNNINKWGTKISYLIDYLKNLIENDNDNRIILFSQWDSMLKLIGKVLNEFEIKHLFLNGSLHVINSRIRKFKLDKSYRVVLISSDKASSGLNLQEANNIILLDTVNNEKKTSKLIEEQAIGRAVRIGQQKQVKVARLIMEDTIEYEYYENNLG